MAEESNNPFGINITKRYVSSGGESELYRPQHIGNHGSIELVDYMGGDGTVERVATAGHGAEIFSENPHREDFIRHLSAKGIYEPFKSVQLKFSFQSPIETALTFVYEPGISVNEYSGRYSVMIDSSRSPPLENIRQSLTGKRLEERAEQIYNLLRQNRKEASTKYQELIQVDLARELARIGLGIDNDTKFFWKIDLLTLANFVNKQRDLLDTKSHTKEYVESVAETAKSVAPYSWLALTHPELRKEMILSTPTDDKIVDGPLTEPVWKPSNTSRVTVPDLEKILFERQHFLNHGEFQVVDYMGDDSAFAQAARTSYGAGTKTLGDDKNLIRSLVRDLHTSPIEMCELSFESKAPVFIDPRQAGRHRTLDNHGFMGYMPIGSQFYEIPESEMKYQDRKNRQGRGKYMDPEDKEQIKNLSLGTLNAEKAASIKLRELGAPEEIVRLAKGVGFYTKRWRTGDTHNTGHFLRLRLDAHAQKEIRDYAQLVANAQAAHTPIAHQAIQDYVISGMRLSVKEIELLRNMIQEGKITKDVDLSNIDIYKGVGFIVKKKDSEEKELSREGQGFRAKLERIIRKSE